MTQEQLMQMSAFLNTQADLPVNIQVIADELKATLTPIVESEPVVEAPVNTEEEVASTEEEVSPSSEESNG